MHLGYTVVGISNRPRIDGNHGWRCRLRSLRRNRENQQCCEILQGRGSDLDPILASPYGPAASEGRTNRPNRRQYLTACTKPLKNLLASPGASIDAASPGACGPPATGCATPGCSPPASRPGGDGAPPSAIAPDRRPTRSDRRQKWAVTFLRCTAGRANGRRLSSVMVGVALSWPRQKVAEQRISTRSQRLTPRSPPLIRTTKNNAG